MQLLLERARSQQEQVVRLTQQLGGVRDELSAVRGRQSTLKVALDEAEKAQKAGLKSDAEMNAINAELSNLNQFEQRLSERELQLASELELERATLNELKTRLDKLEQEIATPSGEPTKKKD
jgi:DNA anti-recombination protein RmuC